MVHVPTLVLMSALLIAFSGAMLVLLRGTNRRLDALAVWGLAMLTGALGLLIEEGGQAPPQLQGPGGTTVLLSASALSWVAGRMFAEQPAMPWLMVAGPALWLAVSAWMPPHGAGALASLIAAAYACAMALSLARCRTEGLPSLCAALGLLVAHALVFTARAASVIVLPPTLDAPVATMLLIESVLHTTGMSMVLLALSCERSERRGTAQLRSQALQDGLTGIGNRRHFDREMETEFRRAVRAGQSLALLMLDVDHFKLFNDRYGHLQGDACLRRIATAIASQVNRPGDVIARFGGEEFVVLLPDTDAAGARLIAETVRRTVEAIGIPHMGGVGGVVTVSVGVAAWAPARSASGPPALLRAADAALYDAKEDGRNRVGFAGALEDTIGRDTAQREAALHPFTMPG